jgi:hypothetical protein
MKKMNKYVALPVAAALSVGVGIGLGEAAPTIKRSVVAVADSFKTHQRSPEARQQFDATIAPVAIRLGQKAITLSEKPGSTIVENDDPSSTDPNKVELVSSASASDKTTTSGRVAIYLSKTNGVLDANTVSRVEIDIKKNGVGSGKVISDSDTILYGPQESHGGQHGWEASYSGFDKVPGFDENSNSTDTTSDGNYYAGESESQLDAAEHAVYGLDDYFDEIVAAQQQQ